MNSVDSSGTLTEFGITKVEAEFGALEDAGLDASMVVLIWMFVQTSPRNTWLHQ